MTTPPLSPILDHKDTAGLQTSSDDPSTPSRLSAAVAISAQLFLFNYKRHSSDGCDGTVSGANSLLINKSTPEPYHNDTTAN
jgi:hypothetical protein